MTIEPAKTSSKGSSATGGSSPSSDVETIPGLTGGGTGANGQRGSDSGSGSSGGSSSGSGGSSSGSGGGFSQGNTQPSNPSEATGQKVIKGSMLAVVIAVVAVIVL